LWWQDEFVVFSPERFVRIADGVIRTHPMKGTIDANLPDAAARILNDFKERAEHFTIVDLLRNDLNRVAKKVRVERFRYLDHIITERGSLLQVSSEIAGDMPGDWRDHIGDILLQLLPAGSVTGAPKRKTVEIINAIEGYERGFYTGVFGVFDGQVFDSAVMIRFIENIGGQLMFKSGGGITALSDARKEYQEMIDKVYVPIARNHQD
jgi:para-aminobenzoate synthetase component 1